MDEKKLPRVKLRDWRTKRQLLIREAAARFGCSTNHLSNIETGVRRPGVELWRSIKRTTRIDLYAE